ncbi:MAG: sugar MFS transporter [Edaphocola sp.]
MSCNSTKNNHYRFGLLLIGCLFFSFGFITWANSQLIPYLKIACDLTVTQSYLVATAFFAAYFFTAIPSSYVLNKTGYKVGMCLGLVIMAIGAAIFMPAATMRSFPLFLAGLFIQGTGLSLLQTASNPYVTILGPISGAAQRISIMGICNKVAGILAVVVLGGITLKDADAFTANLAALDPTAKAAELDRLAARAIQPYMVITAALLALAIIFYFMKLPEVQEEAEEADLPAKADSTKSGVLQFPHLILGALAIFFYVGVEVISYDTFSTLGTSLGYSLDLAKSFAAVTGFGMLVGYLLSIILIPKFISQRVALVVAVAASMVLVLFASFLKGGTGILHVNLGLESLDFHIPTNAAALCFALLGFTNSVMWPAIWPLSLEGLGKYTKVGGALLIMGIVGGAVVTPLLGVFAKAIGSQQHAYLLMIPCYLYILYFALKGHKAR